MSSILDQIREQVNALSADQVREQLQKLQAQKAKQREHAKGRPSKPHGPLTPEQLEKRKAYNRARITRPEVKAKMKAYHSKPEVKERMKEYRQKRDARNKELIARAREMAANDPSLESLLPKPRKTVVPTEQTTEA
jgi:hypothetical protein